MDGGVALAELRDLCTQLPAAQEYVMVHHPAFRVGKKPFVIVGMNEGTPGATVSINLGRDAQPMLLDDTRFSKTPYIGQHGWVTIARKALGAQELRMLVIDSWRRVANKKQLAEFDAKAAATTRDPVAAKRGSRGRPAGVS